MKKGIIRKIIITALVLCLFGCQSAEKEVVSIEEYPITFQETLNRMDSGEDFIVMLGFETCPWCVALKPVLSEFLSGKEIDYYYLDVYNEDGMDVRKEDIDETAYDELYEKIKPFLDETETLYVPTILYISGGEIKGIHVGTVDTHNAHERDMTVLETKQLKEKLQSEFTEWMTD